MQDGILNLFRNPILRLGSAYCLRHAFCMYARWDPDARVMKLWRVGRMRVWIGKLDLEGDTF